VSQSISEHYAKVKEYAASLGGDGCSAVPDLWFRPCCDEHDIAYRTGHDVNGEPISRWAADRAFRKCMYDRAPAGRVSPTAWLYWLGVRVFGGSSWASGSPVEAA
jgi:hypothetical protein